MAPVLDMVPTFQRLVQRAAYRCGISITRTPGPRLWHQLRQFITENKISLVIDVGAFEGQFCNVLRKDVQYDGPIISFEPSSSSFAKLRGKMERDRKWRGFQYGLSDRETIATLNTYGTRGDFNSLLRLDDDAANVYGVNPIANPEDVTLTRLDSVWDEVTEGLGHPIRALLKIDTQGHDIAVVVGCSGILHLILGILSEMSVLPLYQGAHFMADALNTFRNFGYLPIGFFPVNTPAEYGLSPEFDVLLKRRYRTLGLCGQVTPFGSESKGNSAYEALQGHFERKIIE